MTKFEFVLNKFYEITAWSLFAAVAMMALSVAIIFFIISMYSWTKGNREAQKLNQCLKKRNDNES